MDPGRRHGRRRRRTKIESAFAPRLIEMLGSPAYAVLSLAAHRVLARLEIELASHGGKENGNLPCTYDDLMRYGIDRDSIAPALRELQALGFIEWAPGRAGNAEFRVPGGFRLTYRHKDYDQPTHEWRRVVDVSDAKRIASEARPKKGPARLPRKQKASREKPQLSVGETPTETASSIVRKPPITPSDGKPPLLYVCGGGGREQDAAQTSGLATGDPMPLPVPVVADTPPLPIPRVSKEELRASGERLGALHAKKLRRAGLSEPVHQRVDPPVDPSDNGQP